MKKAVLALVLGFVLSMPMIVFASTSVSFSPDGRLAAAVLLAEAINRDNMNSYEDLMDVLSGERSSALPKGMTSGEVEIYALGHQPADLSLLKQAAGGDLNTADILK